MKWTQNILLLCSIPPTVMHGMICLQSISYTAFLRLPSSYIVNCMATATDMSKHEKETEKCNSIRGSKMSGSVITLQQSQSHSLQAIYPNH